MISPKQNHNLAAVPELCSIRWSKATRPTAESKQAQPSKYFVSESRPVRWSSTFSATEETFFHADAMRSYSDLGIGLITASNVSSAEEAIAITRAAMAQNLFVSIAFRIDKNGKIPNGQALHYAIAQVDNATCEGPAFFMVECDSWRNAASLLKRPHPNYRRIRRVGVAPDGSDLPTGKACSARGN